MKRIIHGESKKWEKHQNSLMCIGKATSAPDKQIISVGSPNFSEQESHSEKLRWESSKFIKFSTSLYYELEKNEKCSQIWHRKYEKIFSHA